MTTREREHLTLLLTGLARNGPDLTADDAAAAREAAGELYQLGRGDHGRELAIALRELVDTGALRSPAVLAMLGPLLPPGGVVHAHSVVPPGATGTYAAGRCVTCGQFPPRPGWEQEEALREHRRQHPGISGLPLGDDDSEAQADAAERLAGFGWQVTGTPEPGALSTTGLISPNAGTQATGIAPPAYPRTCADGGACHHSCTTGCWRVRNASPLGAAGWGDQWPEDVRQANADSDGVL